MISIMLDLLDTAAHNYQAIALYETTWYCDRTVSIFRKFAKTIWGQYEHLRGFNIYDAWHASI